MGGTPGRKPYWSFRAACCDHVLVIMEKQFNSKKKKPKVFVLIWSSRLNTVYSKMKSGHKNLLAQFSLL